MSQKTKFFHITGLRCVSRISLNYLMDEADYLNRMVHFVIIWSGIYYYAGVGRRNSEK